MEVSLNVICDSHNSNPNFKLGIVIDVSEYDGKVAKLNVDGRVITVKLSELQYALGQP